MFRWAAHTHRRFICAGLGWEDGGCWIGRHGGVRQARHPGYFPLRAQPPPLWRLLMFLCLVWGGGEGVRFPACRGGGGVGSPDSQRITSSQVSFVGPPPCRRSEIRLCARVLPGAGGLRQQIARLDTGGAVVGGMGV